MPEDKNATVYEAFREVVDEYSDQKGDDLLTDPAAVAAAQEQAEQQEAVTPAQNLKAAREKQGFSIQELAQKTGIPQTRTRTGRSRTNYAASRPGNQTEQGPVSQDGRYDLGW